MGLHDLSLKPAYDSEDDDVVNDFYIPALSESVLYRRLAGFFSSSALSIAARGISFLIANGGKIELVVGARLSKEDVEAIREGTETPEHVIETSMIKDIGQIEDEFTKNHFKALAWMIAQKKLEMKVAILTDDSGFPLDEKTVEKMGLFHQKVGIFQDKNGDVISFSGSINESASGWLRNIEEFKIFRSWGTEYETEQLKSDWQKFEKYWYRGSRSVKVIDIPDAVKNKLIEIAPERIEILSFHYPPQPKKKGVTLYDYQEEAVRKWLENKGRGLFEMATGAGKTFIALGCAKEIERKNEKFVMIVVCPFKHLVTQWLDKDLPQFDFDGIKIYDKNFKEWSNDLSNKIFELNMGYRKKLVIGTTYNTFSKKEFIEIVSKIETPILLIADEVHIVGSPKFQDGLLEKYVYRIGLSATPKRYYDTEGTKIIYDYFGETVYEFSIKQAINTINPLTGQTYLTPYEYHPRFVELTPEEYQEYKRLTKQLIILHGTKEKNAKADQQLELVKLKRARILRDAENKYAVLEDLLQEIKSIDHCLIYTSPKQIKRTQDILNNRGIIQAKITFKEDSRRRKEILKGLDNGVYNSIVAMKCLDVGVDVPSTKMAIILASTGNPIEYVQRRGRILRRYPGKEKSIIYDILVIPKASGSAVLSETEKSIILKELKRYEEFAESAINQEAVEKMVSNVIKKLNLE